jgi:hypothetical protein
LRVLVADADDAWDALAAVAAIRASFVAPFSGAASLAVELARTLELGGLAELADAAQLAATRSARRGSFRTSAGCQGASGRSVPSGSGPLAGPIVHRRLSWTALVRARTGLVPADGR